jgi:hypothetical protein
MGGPLPRRVRAGIPGHGLGGSGRVAFAFDPERAAILLVAGDKSGASQKRFYRSLIDRADRRLDDHLKTLTKTRKEASHGPDA